MTKVSYSTLKRIVDNPQTLFWILTPDGNYETYCVVEGQLIACFFGEADKVDFEARLKVADNTAPSQTEAVVLARHATAAPKDSGKLRVVVEKPSSTRVNFYSHNWTDPTTWAEHSVAVVAETASSVSDYWQLAHDKVIDTFHGQIFGEDFLKDGSGNSYRVHVTVDGVAKTEIDPHTGAGDYVVDYLQGRITPNSSWGSAAVLVTYHYATTSVFTVRPEAGKRLLVNLAEVQFSHDIIVNDTVKFQAYGKVEVFAPQYCPSPYPVGTLIPLGNASVYKNMSDYFQDAVRSYPSYPALGGDGWRSCGASTVLDWDYLSNIVLSSAAGMEIRMFLEHDTPFGGDFATATLYCSTEAE